MDIKHIKIDLTDYKRIKLGDGWYRDLTVGELGMEFHTEGTFDFLYKYLEILENALCKKILLFLPCKVGDTIYEVDETYCGIWDFQVEKIEVYENFDIKILDKYGNGYSTTEFGITLFTDKEEAKRKFEEIKGKLK